MNKNTGTNKVFNYLLEDVLMRGYKVCYDENEGKQLNKKIALLVRLAVNDVKSAHSNLKLEKLMGKIRLFDDYKKRISTNAKSVKEISYVDSINEVEQRLVRELASSLGKLNEDSYVGVDSTVSDQRKELALYALGSSNAYDYYFFARKNPGIEAEQIGNKIANKSTVLLACFLRDCTTGENREELFKKAKDSNNPKVREIVADIENKKLKKLLFETFNQSTVEA